jgi:hypothetical protein
MKCQPTALRPVVQERQETSRSTQLISHEDNDHFVVNMAAVHNATLLRRALPIALTVPRPIYLDRKAHHQAMATGLRDSQKMKRIRTQEKRKATMAAKAQLKKDKAGKTAAQTYPDSDDSGDEIQMDDPSVVPKRRQRKKQKTV